MVHAGPPQKTYTRAIYAPSEWHGIIWAMLGSFIVAISTRGVKARCMQPDLKKCISKMHMGFTVL